MSDFFQHPRALVESQHIGKGTRVWAFAHVLPQAVIGQDCNVCDHVFVENDVIVGDRVTIKCGVQLWDGVRLEDDVFVGPNVTFTNDPAPRSKRHLSEYPQTFVRKGASIGANATILPGITIGQHAMVGAGAVVTRSVPPYAVVVGNPARIVRYVEADDKAGAAAAKSSAPPAPEIRVEEVQLLRAPIIKDLRGNLSARETGKGLPFTPERCFFVFDVPSKEVRGEHAHRVCKQFLVCLRGSLAVVCDDGSQRQEFLLDTPELGLYLPPMVWGIQYKYSADSLLLVLASHGYDAGDYIRNYDQFVSERRAFDASRQRASTA
jgi:UDP-2-acetamido-3-amino-2,3-dideoxy-glucuronate N-acetyltransferase